MKKNNGEIELKYYLLEGIQLSLNPNSKLLNAQAKRNRINLKLFWMNTYSSNKEQFHYNTIKQMSSR